MGIKQNIKRLISCILIIGLVVILIDCSTELLESKRSNEKYKSFFSQEENFDILFLGSSHMKYTILPMELWSHYGIVSYNMGVETQVLPGTYWQMKSVLDHTSPKLVVIDCYYLSEARKSYGWMHAAWDGLPLNKTKIEAVFDLLDDEETDLTPMEFFWNYSFYHNRWNELREDDFEQKYINAKGSGYIIEIVPGSEITEIPKENKLEEDTVGIEYLERMIEDCQSRGVDVLLTYLPFPAQEKEQKEANRVYDIAEKYGVDYINFLDLDIVNYQTDCADDEGHLNLLGSRKTTDYLGQYITEHYDVEDQRDNEAYYDWCGDYADYRNRVIAEFQSCESLDYRLLFLSDKDILTFIEVYDPKIWDNNYYVNLFESLGIDREKITEDTDFLVIQNAGQQVACLDDFKESDRELTSEYGKIQIFSSGTGTYGVYLDGNELYTVTPEQDPDADIRIVVVDKETKVVIDQSCFSKTTEALRLYKKN